MQFYDNLKKAEEKLATILLDENLVHTFSTKTYPITLIVSNDRSPGAQMEFYATGDDGKSSAEAVLKLIFNLNGLKIQTDNRFVIEDAMMNKIKNQAKKMYHAYLEGYYAQMSAQAAEACAEIAAACDDGASPVCDDDAADAFADFMADSEPVVADEDANDTEGIDDTEDEEG